MICSFVRISSIARRRCSLRCGLSRCVCVCVCVTRSAHVAAVASPIRAGMKRKAMVAARALCPVGRLGRLARFPLIAGAALRALIGASPYWLLRRSCKILAAPCVVGLRRFHVRARLAPLSARPAPGDLLFRAARALGNSVVANHSHGLCNASTADDHARRPLRHTAERRSVKWRISAGGRFGAPGCQKGYWGVLAADGSSSGAFLPCAPSPLFPRSRLPAAPVRSRNDLTLKVGPWSLNFMPVFSLRSTISPFLGEHSNWILSSSMSSLTMSARRSLHCPCRAATRRCTMPPSHHFRARHLVAGGPTRDWVLCRNFTRWFPMGPSA